MDYVNIHGRKVVIPTGAAPKKAPSASERKTKSGWIVVGYPTEMVAAARRAHEAAREAAIKGGQAIPLPWDLGHWMRNTRPKRARSQPYELPSSAGQCARMMESQAHWVGVRLEAVGQK